MTTFTAEDKLNCATRELRLRTRVYPRLVDKGKMTTLKYKLEIELMAAIVEDYRELATKERLI